MLNRQFSKREKVLLVILALLVIGIAYYIFVWQATNTQIEAATVRKTETENAIVVEQTRAEMLDQMRAELALLDESEADAAEIPAYDNAKQVMRLLNGVLSASQGYNVSFSNVDFSGNLALRSLQLNFQCANYAHAKEIIRSIYGGPYRCDIGAMTFTAMAAPDGVIDMARSPVNVNMAITFYEYTTMSAEEGALEMEEAESEE